MNISLIQVCSNEITGLSVVHASFFVKKPGPNDPYMLKAATGLDAPDIIKTYNDGPKFFRMRPDRRVVSFLIKLNPDYRLDKTVGDLRDHIYRAITFNTHASTWNGDSKIELKFWDGERYIASLFGFVTKMETSSFTSEAQLVLEIECEYPFFRSGDVDKLGINNSPPAHHHTYQGIDYPVGAVCHIFDDDSTAQHGFQMVIEVQESQPRLIIWDIRNPEKYLFWLVYDFLPGDIIRFSSNEDNKNVYIERDSTATTLMDRFLWGSIWTFLLPGLNVIELSEGVRILDAWTSNEYWGI